MEVPCFQERYGMSDGFKIIEQTYRWNVKFLPELLLFYNPGEIGNGGRALYDGPGYTKASTLYFEIVLCQKHTHKLFQAAKICAGECFLGYWYAPSSLARKYSELCLCASNITSK
jgi:hypothetical protein